MAVITVSLFLLYITLLIVLIMGWNSAMARKINPSQVFVDEPLFSVIIAARDEESNIAHLLDDLSKQRYNDFQVIIVDDHSGDMTREIVQQFVEKDCRFHLLVADGKGKKQALAQGVQAAEGAIIATTDADCRVPENWIARLNNYFGDDTIKLVFGGVKMVGNSFFSKLQSVEFLSLIGSGAATAALGLPTLCNGANMAFRKSAFEAVDGYSGNLHIPSGDDEFLMRKILNRYPKGVTFVADPLAVVTTSPNRKLIDLVYQRIRWAGKWSLHTPLFHKALALATFCFQTTLIIFPALLLLHLINPVVALLLWLSKVGFELFFLRRVARFLQVSWSWSAFLLLQVVYPIYVVIIGIISNFSPFEWKGRKSKSLVTSSN